MKGLGLIPGQETRPYMLQLKIPCAATKTCCNPTNKNKYLKKKKKMSLGDSVHYVAFPSSPCWHSHEYNPSPHLSVLFLICCRGGPLLSSPSSLASLSLLPSSALSKALSLACDDLGCPLFAISEQKEPRNWSKPTKGQAAAVYWADSKDHILTHCEPSN